MSGKRKFTAKDVVKLEKIFGLSAEYLLQRDDGLPAIASKAATGAKISAARRGESPYKNLLAELDKLNLSYTGLAKLLDLPRKSISNKIRGIYNFNEEEIAKLVAICDKPAEYILARDDGKIFVSNRYETPYKNLLAEMEKRRLTYTELAKLLGLSHCTVSDKMRGKYNFTARDKARLEEIFGLPAECLLERVD